MRPELLVLLVSFLVPRVAKSQLHDDFTGKTILSQWTWSDPGKDAKFALLAAFWGRVPCAPPRR